MNERILQNGSGRPTHSGGRVKGMGFHRAVMIFLLANLVFISPSTLAASKKLNGRWLFTITMPESPGTEVLRTFTVTLDVSPRIDSLHGRMTITDEQQRTVGGVWRQNGKKVSIAYELPCETGVACASVVLLGKIKGKVSIKKGDVIVMWDVPNSRNHAQYETSVGSFTGDRLE